MKKLLLTILSFSLFQMALAQSVTLSQGSYTEATFNVATPKLNTNFIEVDGDKYVALTFDGGTHLFRDGEPDLPIISQTIEIPLCSDIEVAVSNIQTRSFIATMSGTQVLPMQPAPSKADRGPQPFVKDSAIYATDAFYAAPNVAWVDVIGIARDRRLAALRVSPVSYNPVTGQVQVITSLTVTLTYKNADISATRELHRRYYSPAFTAGGNILSTLPADKSVRQDAPIHYLIVAHSDFRGALDGFIDWKRRCGMLVTVGYTDEPQVGTSSTAIANYIKGFYNNATDELPAPTYLLIVGDNEQIPAFASRCSQPASDHISDLYFVTWDGDNIPDCYRGRFSAKNLLQLAPQISKTLLYEQYTFTDPSYLARGVLIAGEDQGRTSDNAYQYADPTMDYVAKTYITAANGYNNIVYYKNNTSFAPSGVTVTGSSQTSATASALRTLYNQGCGWVNYSAHGSETSWATPEFNTSQVAQMTNNGKPSVFIGNCCLTGSFQQDNCFGESLLRKDNDAGAVAYIGATNSTYWPHDFCWSVGVRSSFSNTMNTSYDSTKLGMYDRLFHTHNENYTLWHNTLGSMVTAGNMAVTDYGSYELYYWEIYQLFGDPSVMPWLGIPSDMPVEAPSVVLLGTTECSINTVPRAYVALTSGAGHELIAATFADATTGTATLNLPSSMDPGTYELVVRAQGYKTSFSEITVTVPQGPYLSAVELNPVAGKVVPGQSNIFDLTVVNQGVETAWTSTLEAFSPDAGVVSLLPSFTLPYIEAGDTLVIPAAVSVFVPADYTYGSRVRVTTQIDFSGRTSTHTFAFAISAPQLEVTDFQTSAAVAGESVSITCTVANTGNDSTTDLTFSLRNIYAMTAIQAQDIHVGVLVPEQSVVLTFSATMVDNLPATFIPFNLYAYDTNNSTLITTINCMGEGDAQETFETGDFTAYSWNRGNNNRWEITNADKHSGTYSARSYSNLGNRRTSSLNISWSSIVDDSISFWYKVSSEEDYDYFTFSIDGSTFLEASGNTDLTWHRAAFAVPAGTHTFTFAYTKDYSATAGSDCAWIDDIVFPYQGEAYNLISDTVCQNAEYSFAGQQLPTSELGTTVYVDSISDSNPVSTWLALTVADNPEVYITGESSVVLGGQLVLTAHGANSYLWNTGDTTATIVVSPTENTTYSVTGYRGGCSGEASIQVAVGINSPSHTEGLAVSAYPNPTDCNVTISCPVAILRIALLDIKGQVLEQHEYQTQTVPMSAIQLTMNNCSKGIYFVKVETAEGTVVKKIVKK